MKKIILFFAIFAFAALPMEAASETDSLWRDAVDAYNGGDYDVALRSFKQIEDLGYSSPELYYNIGNSYYKMSGYIAYSILYYEKALRLDPAYQDAKNNLALAQQFTLDRIETVPEFVLVSWAKGLRNLLPSNTWAYIAVGFFALFAAMMLLFRYGRGQGGRKTAFAFAIVFFVFMAVSVVCSVSLHCNVNSTDEAIIINPVSSIKSSPNDSGKSLLILHEGTKVEILEELGDWRRIEISDGRQGWLLKRDIEII